MSSRLPVPPRPTRFPYTTLFRSDAAGAGGGGTGAAAVATEPGAIVANSTATAVAVLFATIAPGSVATDRKSTRLNSSHGSNSYAVFCLKKKTKGTQIQHRNRRCV